MPLDALFTRPMRRSLPALPVKLAAAAFSGSAVIVSRGSTVLSTGMLALGVQESRNPSTLKPAHFSEIPGPKPNLKGLGGLANWGCHWNLIIRLAVRRCLKTTKNNTMHDTSERGGTHCRRPRFLEASVASYLFHAGRKKLTVSHDFKRPRLAYKMVSLGAQKVNSDISKPGPQGSRNLNNALSSMPICISRIKGSCAVTGWTISQYCEACHG